MYNSRQRLQNQTTRRILWVYFKNGCYKLRKDILGWIVLMLFYFLIITSWKESTTSSEPHVLPAIELFIYYTYSVMYTVIGLIGTVGWILILGMPRGSIKVADEFQRIGLINRAGEPPLVLDVQKKSGNTLIYQFDGAGIPVSEWEDKQAYIEAILNVNVIKVKNGKDNRTVLLYTVPGNSGLSECLDWESAYSAEKKFKSCVRQRLIRVCYSRFFKNTAYSDWRFNR